MNTDLISIKQSTAVEVLSSPDQVAKIIEEVKVKINTLDGGTLETGVGRKKIITNANKAKKSKIAVCKYIDDLVLLKKVEIRDKTLDENETIRLLLQSKEDLSSGLDSVYKEARQCVTDFEANLKAEKAAKEAEAEAIRLVALREADHEIGLLLNDKYDNEKAKAELVAEAERVAKEDKIKSDAAEAATAKAEQDAAAEIAQANQDKINAEQREATAKQDAIDAKEVIRIDYHERMIQHIVACGNGFIGGSPQSFGVLLYELENKIVINESFEEFQQEAEVARNEAIKKLNDCQEKQAKDRKDSESKSKRDTEIAAEQARLAQVKRQQDIETKAAEDQAKRDANKSHTAKVRRTAKDLLIARHNLSEEVAKAIIIDLHKGVFADITINY